MRSFYPGAAEERKEVDPDVREMIRSALLVEDYAIQLKSQKPLKKHEHLYQEIKNPPKALQKVLATSDQETAEDLSIALSLRKEYKKDKNFVRKEDEDL